MTRPITAAHHRAVDRVWPEAALALAETRAAELQLALEVQSAYLSDLVQAQSAMAWAEAEASAARAELAEGRALFAVDVAELNAAVGLLQARLAESEAARELAESNLAGALAVVEQHLDLAEVAA